MRIGELNYSGKATKLIAVLMVCILVFTLAIPAQPAEAVAGTTIALAAGLTLAFVAACGVAFTVNEAQNSSTYWEGQIESYLDDSGLSDVGEWVDFGSVVYDSASGKLRYPGEVLSGLLDFFSWFTGKNGIEAGGSVDVVNKQYYFNGLPCYYYDFSVYTVNDSFISIPIGSSFNLADISYLISDYGIGDNGVQLDYNITRNDTVYDKRCYIGLPVYEAGLIYILNAWPSNSDIASLHVGYFMKYKSGDTCAITGGKLFDDYAMVDITTQAVDYTATAEGTLGIPDIGQKEEKLGYVPDVNIPLPESVAADTNIGDINDASTAVLDYAGTAGNTLDLEYEYVEDTNVDTGTDSDTNEGTQDGTGTDAETGTQTGSVALENVAADSLVEVAPETMLNDDTLMGLFISKFPWCIPFDLYFAISAFAADPVAPEFEVNLFEGVIWEGLDLSGTEMTLSFEAFEKVAAVTRWSTLIIFCAGLAMITKRMIWS